MIRRTAVREISVCRHHGGPFESRSETITALPYWGLRWTINWTLIMPRGVCRTADVFFSSLALYNWIFIEGFFFSLITGFLFLSSNYKIVACACITTRRFLAACKNSTLKKIYKIYFEKPNLICT